MSTSSVPTPQNSKTEYEFEPFEITFLRRRDDVLKLVGVAGHALRSMEGSSRLAKVLRQPPEHVDRVRELEELAQSEVAADFPMLHSAAAVLIWGALEASVRDFLVRWLARHPEARVIPELKNIRVRVAEYEAFEGEERMRYLVGVLERELGASLRPGVGRFECLLRPFGIAPTVTDEERRTLNELAAVRNVIVHRAGVADARLVELCPWLDLAVGDPVNVGQVAYERYIDITSHYAASIIETARATSQEAAAHNHAD